MFGLQDFRQVRIVDLNQRAALQVGAESGYPESQHRDRHSDVLEDSKAEMKVARSVFEVGLDEPEEVKSARKDNPLANSREALLVALDVARQKQRERNQPVEDEIQGDDDAPVAADAIEVPIDL